MKHQSGLSLIELLITVAIVAIIAGIAAPGFNQLVQDNRTTQAANQLLSLINYARSEAIKTRAAVSLCSSNNPGATSPMCAANWGGNTLIAFLDPDGNGAPGGQAQILRTLAIPTALSFRGNSNTNISYGGDGFLQAGNQTLTLDLDGTSDSTPSPHARNLVISQTGRVRINTPGQNTSTPVHP